MRRVWVVALLFLIVIITCYLGDRRVGTSPTPFTPRTPQIPSDQLYRDIGYTSTDPNRYEVSLLTDQIFTPTRLVISPDGQYLLASQITGEVLAYRREGTQFSPTPYLVTTVATNLEGFPPHESGLVGLVFSAAYEDNGTLFLLHTARDSAGLIQNRVSKTVLRVDSGGHLRGTPPQQIFEANIAGNESHQITDGVGVMSDSVPQLLFLIGEGFEASRAQDTSLHAGKAMMIAEDGSKARVVARGVRNAYVMAQDPRDERGRFLIGDTGPDKYDRLIYTNLSVESDEPLINLRWDGVEDHLADPIPDPQNAKIHDMVLLRLPTTLTFSGLDFDESGRVFATVFGKTGSSENTPGKEIWVGEITSRDAIPSLSFTPIVERNPQAEGTLGNPIGLVIDEQTDTIYFADILESRLYKVNYRGEPL